MIGGYDSPARFLPSAATQAARRAALPPADQLRQALHTGLAGLPLSAAKLKPFIADVEAARTQAELDRLVMEGHRAGFHVAVHGVGLSIGAEAPLDRAHLDRVAALVVDLGNPVDHLSCVAREYGIPMLTGIEHATRRIAKGSWIVVNANEGRIFQAGENEALQARRQHLVAGDNF